MVEYARLITDAKLFEDHFTVTQHEEFTHLSDSIYYQYKRIEDELEHSLKNPREYTPFEINGLLTEMIQMIQRLNGIVNLALNHCAILAAIRRNTSRR